MIILYLIGIALFLVLQYYVAKQFESVANDKGYADSKYFHLCFWLGVVGYLLVIALPDRGNGITQSANQPKRKSAVTSVNQDEQKSGECQICGNISSHLTHCKIEDDLGTRYRDICSECMEKFNATPE